MVKNNTEIEAVIAFVDAIICVRQEIKQLAQQKLRELHDREITYEMLQVLTVLWKKHQINQQEVANAIQKHKASLTPLLDSLVELGLVTRREDPADRRNKIITLTKKGKDYRRKFAPLTDAIYTAVKGELSDQRLREMTEILLTVSGNLAAGK